MRVFAKLILLITVSAGSNAVANEIYKWTDADGNVTYGDRPQDDVLAAAERVAIASSRTNASAVSAAVDARRERDKARGEARDAREEAEPTAAEERAEAERVAQQCAEYRQRLESFVTARRLYRMNESGQREFLDEAGMAEARSALQQRIQEQCSS